jgi:hypothetical protein
MDKIKALLEEIDLKAANSSNLYELIMNLIIESSSKLQAPGGNEEILSSGTIDMVYHR